VAQMRAEIDHVAAGLRALGTIVLGHDALRCSANRPKNIP
jgi:hypothetical protein